MASNDEEQLEALQRWWKDNGTSLIIGVVVVLVGFFGWRQWEASQLAGAEEASDLYQQMVALSPQMPTDALAEDDMSTMVYLADQLRSEHESSIYARFAAMLMARLHVQADDLSAAEAQLSWVLDNPELGMFSSVNEALLHTARARLARVLLAQGEAERAQQLVTGINGGTFAGTFAEIEGDALMAQGQREQAGAAYQRAVAAGSDSILIELKLRDLGLR